MQSAIPAFFSPASLPPYDCGAGAEMLVYRETDRAAYEQYLALLRKEGFADYTAHTISENFHTTLLRGETQLHVYYCECEQTLRVIADSAAHLPPHGCEPFTRRRESTLYQFETDHTLIDCGMCYIMQCADNSFFLIDSAHFFSFNDNDRIHKFLRERTPAGEKIIIAGWYFSHGHDDHISKFMDFLQYNCDDVTIENLYFNFVPPTHPDSIHWAHRDKPITKRFQDLCDAHGEIRKVNIHTGQHFFVRNLEFEVLYTHEDLYPQSCENYNCSSCVLRLTVDGTRVIFPGDASGAAADILIARYGTGLKSDIIQVAHHGHFGLSRDFYEFVHAEIALFPTTQIKYDEEFEVYEANRHAAAICKYCYISANGTVAIPLPYSGGGGQLLPDETFEDFKYINRLWGYEYTQERKDALHAAFLERAACSK